MPPLDHELNLTTQALADVSWGLTAALLVIAIRIVWAAISLVESATFENVGIDGGLYSYWGA